MIVVPIPPPLGPFDFFSHIHIAMNLRSLPRNRVTCNLCPTLTRRLIRSFEADAIVVVVPSGGAVDGALDADASAAGAAVERLVVDRRKRSGGGARNAQAERGERDAAGGRFERIRRRS